MKKIVTALLVGTLLTVSAVPSFAEEGKEKVKFKEQLSTEIEKIKEIREDSKAVREEMKTERARIKEVRKTFKENEEKKAEVKEEREKLKSIKEEIKNIREEIKTLKESLKAAKKSKDVEGAKKILKEIATKKTDKLVKLREALEIFKKIK